MELEVHLARDGEEPWGFELVGGADYGIPLTVDKVFPSTPAQTAGLQPGDIVARLGDRLATELSLEAALAIVAEAVGSLSFGICRGLYDPVVDDYEPIYEPIDRADSDLRSEPTEVPFPIQQFDLNELSLNDPNILDPRKTDPGMYDSGYLTRPTTETRSLTASPFVLNSKPYRPFSTEPLEAPPLENPIILNPNYKDTFGFKDPLGNVKALDPKEEELLRLIPLERNVESIFKLPVSEKYDPDWEKKVKEMLERCAEGGRRETQHVEHELVYYAGKATDAASSNILLTKEVKEKDDKVFKEVELHEQVKKSVQITEDEVTFEKKRKDTITMEKIEQTALQVVEESIERALSVTEDIRKEVEEELRASATREFEVKETEATSQIKTHIEEVVSQAERKESVSKNKVLQIIEHETEIINETKQEPKEEIKSSVSKKEGDFSDDDRNKSIEEQKFSIQEELEETIPETIKRKSIAFDEEKVLPPKKEATRKASHVEESKSEKKTEFKSSAFNNETFESEGKQKAYMIGFQTIPHIKGFVQSSYHFDLLLRTFFVHLTDVMVALSRFVLTQPAAELESKAEKVYKEKLIKECVSQEREQYERKKTDGRHEEINQSIQSVKQDRLQNKSENEIRHEKNVVHAKQETKVAKAEDKSRIQQESREYKKEIQEAQQVRHDIKKSEDNKAHLEIVVKDETSKKQETMSLEEVERRKRSGAEMAQMTQRKSKDLTMKMDAVITEFETKTGIEDKLHVTEQNRRRSRSRSQIEEEVMRESDPLEWLDKVDSRRASQERTDVTTIKKEFSALSESKESRKSESQRESRSTKVKPGKQMYIAIVESHVYTNKDAILEDQVAEISETASVQSSEEINAALESLETISMENVAISQVQTEEKQQAVEKITNALQEVVQEKQEVLEAVTDFKSHITEQHSKSVIQESHTSVAAESTEILSQSKVGIFEAEALKESKAVAVQEVAYKTAAVEFIDVPLEATKEIIIESKASKQEAVAEQELLATVAAESAEIITDESRLETIEAKKMVAKTATVSAEGNFKATALSATEMLFEASKEEKTDLKVSEKKAVANAESLTIAVAESTDVLVDDSNVEMLETKELISKKAKERTEETFKTAAVGSTEVTFEEVQEQHLDLVKTDQVTIRQETRALPVAGIIETKTEVCKEPKKPAEDEHASLKIVKEVVIDGGKSTEILCESELNVKKNLDIDISSSQHIQSSISQSKERYKSVSQEISSLVQESYQSSAKSSTLRLRTDLAQQIALDRQISGQSDENNNTPSPSTVPPTPLTDEYVFKLEIPLPKNQGTIVVEESPDREDPHIVKKGLIPHVEIVIEDQIIYDPPLPTPPEDKVQSPVYTKPGLRGGAEPLFRKEYIREIERKSSLLASAIDQTIKSIEEYKEEVGMETKKEVNIKKSLKSAMKTEKHEEMNGFIHTNGFTNGHGDIDREIESKMKEEWQKVETQVAENDENLKELTNGKEQSKDMVGGTENGVIKNEQQGKDEQNDALPGFKPVVFNPEAFQAKLYEEVTRGTCEIEPREVKMYVNESGEPLGTTQGIVDGLEEAVVDEEVAKELGKPGLTDDKIAELISGESEMLREAHVMGLARVLTSHMTRDDSSVDFTQIKPLVESLKDSEVLKALNEELMREHSEEKKKKEKKQEQKWTTFMQKPKRPVPRARFGYFGYVEPEQVEIEEPYKVKIVKQPKPKVAPDYKPEDFNTGPLPWEERALTEPVPSPVPPEEPILVPEETPEFLEAVDPLPESEVPDLEDTGIPLPQPPPSPPTLPPEPLLPELPPDLPEEPPPEPPEPEVEPKMHGNQNQMAEQLVNTVRSMVDPSAPLEQQLVQMRAQLAALAQLPCVIQQSLEMLTRQLSTKNHQEAQEMSYEAQMNMETHQKVQAQNTMEPIPENQVQEAVQNDQEPSQNYQEEKTVTIEEVQPEQKPLLTAEEYSQLKREEVMMEEQRKSEKEKKEQQEKLRLEQESRQIKQRAAPRVGKPTPVFGPLAPENRPVVLPGGRRWRGPKDAYNEQLIADTLQAQSEILMGKIETWNRIWPWGNTNSYCRQYRINFMKYEKPPVSLDHLQNSATYKMIHNMEQEPLRRTDLLTPVIAEADYRERCRSATPVQTNGRM